MSLFTPLFTQHARGWQDFRYVYPVISRRSRGLSIGVNLNRDKVCNFDCLYCSVDRTGPRPSVREEPVNLSVLEAELNALLQQARSGALFGSGPLAATPPALRRLNDIALSGDAEPTSSPAFPAACRLAQRLLDEHGLTEVRVVVITNATLLHRPEVAAGVEALDPERSELWAKLDAGTEAYYQRVNRSAVPLTRVLENLRLAGQHRPIIVQALFMRVGGEPPPESEIGAWLGRLEALRAAGSRVAGVQVYTTARATAEATALPLEAARLDAIAERVRALGFKADVYYGPE